MKIKNVMAAIFTLVFITMGFNVAYAADKPIDVAVMYAQYVYPEKANIISVNDAQIVEENKDYYLVTVSPDWDYYIGFIVLVQKGTNYVVYGGPCQDYSEIESYMDQVSPYSYADFNGLSYDISINVNGNKIACEEPPYNNGVITMVPLRDVFGAIGASISYDANTKAIKIVKNGTTLELSTAYNDIKLNGYPNDFFHYQAVNRNGHTMVPIVWLSEAFGCDVDWNEDTNVLSIVDNNKNQYVGGWAAEKLGSGWDGRYSYEMSDYMLEIYSYENGLISGRFVRNSTHFRDYGISYYFKDVSVVNNTFTLKLKDKWNNPIMYEGDTGITEWTSDYIIRLNGNSIDISNPNGEYGEERLIKYLKTEYESLQIYVK